MLTCMLPWASPAALVEVIPAVLVSPALAVSLPPWCVGHAYLPLVTGPSCGHLDDVFDALDALDTKRVIVDLVQRTHDLAGQLVL